MQVAHDRPRFRQDLVAELVEDQNTRFIDVMDPDSGNVFRFYEVEYSLACAMDGERDVAGIVKWAQEELGLTPSANEVQMVIATLSDLAFIAPVDTLAEDGKAAKAAPTAPATPAPVAAVAKDDQLAPGIVVGKPAVVAAVAVQSGDVELGHYGAGTAPAARKDDLPAADFDLGAPGAAPAKQAAAKSPAVEDIGLGAPGARPEQPRAAQPPAPVADVSLDLADHLAIGAADVKEAVRASKVMSAVEVPKDLMDQLDAPAKPVEAKAAQPVEKTKPVEAKADKPVEKAKPVEAKADKPAEKTKPVEAKAEKAKADTKAAEKAAAKPAEKAKADTKAAEKAAAKGSEKTKPAVELPKQPEAQKAKSVPTAPASGVSPVLVILLILAVVGATAFFVWKFVINKPDGLSTTSQTTPPPKPMPPPPPPEVTSKVVIEMPPALEVKASVAGTVESIEAAEKDVKGGDVLGYLAGAKPLQTEIATLTKSVETMTTALAPAEKALADAQQVENNEAGVKAAQAKLDAAKKPLDAKKATLATKQADLDKLAIKASGDGKLAEPVAAGAKVAVDAVIVKIVKAPLATATFKVPAGTKIAADGTLSITAAGKPVVCTVIDAQAETVKVSCPTDAGLADGAPVSFKLPAK